MSSAWKKKSAIDREPGGLFGRDGGERDCVEGSKVDGETSMTSTM